jgi:hypothetical protein
MALSQEIEMFGLTPLGILHTAISPIAVIAALIAFFSRQGNIDQDDGRQSLRGHRC